MLKTKKDLHLARKFWHIGGVALLCYIYLSLPYDKLIVVGGLLTASVLFLDFTRLNFSRFNVIVQKVFGFFLRRSEKDHLSGLSFMVVGAYLVALLFPKEVVLCSYFFLGLGDPLASIIGIKYGKHKIGSKSLEGSIASFTVCSLIALGLFFYFQTFGHRIWIAVPVAGLIGSLSELVTIKKIDDNLSLPMLSGFGIWILIYCLGV